MREDWITPWWQAVCLPRKWDVCGFIVPSLSVWHTFALENIGNGFLCGGIIDYDDAASLLLFACRDMKQGLRLIHGHNYRARQMFRMSKRLNKADWRELEAACSEYVTACTRGVSRWQKGGSKSCAVPYQFHIVLRLCRDYGLTQAQAWNSPYGMARACFDASTEAAGDDSIMNHAAQEMEDNWGEYKDITGEKNVELVGMN